MTMLSPGAERLLLLLTPEPIPLTDRERDTGSVHELARLGLAKVEWVAGVYTICLTASGRRPELRN